MLTVISQSANVLCMLKYKTTAILHSSLTQMFILNMTAEIAY